ncbi:OTU domain-containing protein [Citrobacter youngae]|uniref:hypothetical protein n=1 Tax=Citrobacter youngae TaxID=133448 RepID=UPI00387E0FC9
MGTLTLNSGSGDGKGTLNLHVPAKHVGNPLVHYSLVEKDGGTTFARTLDRKERMTLIADSATDSKGNKLISAKGIQYNGKNISWGNIIAWQEPEAEYSTFDKSNNIANLKLFIREKNQNIILNEKNELPLGVLYGKESLQTYFPTFLDTSKSFQDNKISECINSLIHEFGSGVPARVIGIGTDADVKESFGKDKLYHLQNNINSMFRNSNGKNWESLQQSKRHADSQALTRFISKKNYTKGMDALCADWSAKSIEGWTEKDKLRCAVIENLVKEGRLKFISKADAAKYLPTIYNGEKFKLYINTVYANSDYRTVLGNMVNSNDFSGIQDVKTVSSRVRAENIKSAISSLEELASINPKKIKRELKRKEKDLLNHLEHNGFSDDDAKTSEYGQEIGKLARQLNLLKNKTYRKEIISLKIELKNITGAEPGSMASMVAVCLKNNNVENEFSQKGINTLRELRDSKISGLHELKKKYERESSRQQIAWLDNHIETLTVKEAAKTSSVVKSYYNQLSLKDKVLFLQQESTVAWDKYASYSGKEHTSANRELARKYHHLAITRESQLKYLLSSIEKMVDIKGADFTFSSHALREIRSLNDDKLTSVNGTALSHNQNKESKEQCLATEKQAKRINEFLKWASDLPQNAKTNATVGQLSQPEVSEHVVDTQATEAAVSQSSESVVEGSVIDLLATDAVVGQTSEQVEKDLFIDMLSSEEEMGQASESEVEDKPINTQATEAAVSQSSEQVEKDLFIDMLSSEEEMGRASESEVEDKSIDTQATEAAVSQSSESIEDKPIVGLHSGNKTLASNVSTVPEGPNTPEFKITFNDKVYTLKNVNALEEMARKTSDRAERKQLLEEIKEQKSIFEKINIPFKDVEFTENGMTVTELQKQKNLLVQIKYFYDSNGKYNEDATEYTPISGSGHLKIPGVKGKIDTIPGCTYKRNFVLTHLPEVFPDGYSKKDIIAVKKMIPENKKYGIIRTMSKSEKEKFIADIKLTVKDMNDFASTNVHKFNACFQQPDVVLNIDTKNPKTELEEKYGKQYIQKIIELVSKRYEISKEESIQIKNLDSVMRTAPEEGASAYQAIKTDMENRRQKQDDLIKNVLLEKGLQLKPEKYNDFIYFFNSNFLKPSVLTVANDTTVGFSCIQSSLDNFKEKDSLDYVSLFFDTPLEIPVDSIFLEAEHKNDASVNVNIKGVNKRSNTGNKTCLLLPAEILIKKFESIRNGNETMSYHPINERQNIILGNNKESIDNIFEQLKPTRFSIEKLKSGQRLFKHGISSFETFSPHTEKSLSNGGYYYFDDESSNMVKTKLEADKAAASVKSASSPVNENVAQALPLPSQEPSQLLQENNAIKKTVSGWEIRRLQESPRSLISNSNEAFIKKNEQVVGSSQNTDNIKRHDESGISTDDVNSSVMELIGEKYRVDNSASEVPQTAKISNPEVALTKKEIFLKKEILNEIDFKKFHSQIDGEIAVLALYSYLASEGIRLHVLNDGHDGNGLLGRVDLDSKLVNRGLKIETELETNKDIYVFLENGHYDGFSPSSMKSVQVNGDGNCLFHSAAAMLNRIAMNNDVAMKGDDLNAMTKVHLEDNFDRFVTAFFNAFDEARIKQMQNGDLKTHSEKLFSLVKEYKESRTKTKETVAVQPADDLPQSKTSERGLSRKELNRLYSNRAVLVQ